MMYVGPSTIISAKAISSHFTDGSPIQKTKTNTAKERRLIPFSSVSSSRHAAVTLLQLHLQSAPQSKFRMCERPIAKEKSPHM